jgi:hypothetical protein
MLICLISFNILSAVLGNEIIKYLNLEEKFSKLAVFLRLRLKFQRYYLILSFSLIFFYLYRLYSNKYFSFILKRKLLIYKQGCAGISKKCSKRKSNNKKHILIILFENKLNILIFD